MMHMGNDNDWLMELGRMAVRLHPAVSQAANFLAPPQATRPTAITRSTAERHTGPAVKSNFVRTATIFITYNCRAGLYERQAARARGPPCSVVSPPHVAN